MSNTDTLCRGDGSVASTARYQNRIWNSSGRLRIELDVAAGQPRHQPVRRQPAKADDEAEDGRKEDADHGDQQRVQKTDNEDARVAVGFLVRDQALADAEAGRVLHEAEAGGDALGLQVGLRVRIDLVAEPDDEGDERKLRCEAAPAGAPAKGAPQMQSQCCRGGLLGSIAIGQPPPAEPSAYRAGGAYWMPPWFHRRLRPRWMFSFDPGPTLRSNDSP